MANPAVLQRFTTEKYKRFWYPTRPLFTLISGLFLASLGVVGILPMSWTLYLSAAFAFDDLPLTPIMALITAGNNLAHGRKKIKAMIMITTISVAALTGALLGFFVLSQLPTFMLMTTGYIAATSCSPVLISIGAVIGGLTAHLSNKISPFAGTLLGIFMFSNFLPPAPLMVDVVFVCAASFAFVSSIVAKQALRTYYLKRYGHSNADGYGIDKETRQIDSDLKSQAQKFSVSTSEFTMLVNHCRHKVSSIKREATWLKEYSNQRQPESNSYKDIYHGLMNTSATTKDINSIKKLIVDSTKFAPYNRFVAERNEMRKMELASTPSGKLRDDISLRTEYHKVQIFPGIASSLTQPFSRIPVVGYY